MSATCLHADGGSHHRRSHARQLSVSDIGVLAHRSLCHEIATWPKPGLVSHIDCGSHTDMDANLLQRSAGVLQPFFEELAAAGVEGVGMEPLRAIGLAAEAAMLEETRGVNAHRGAIFGLGLLCAAAGTHLADDGPSQSLGDIVRERWGDAINTAQLPPQSHGTTAARRYGVAGARGEAAAGFPSIYDIGLPALGQGTALAAGDPEATRVHVIFALIAGIDDTNLLHRGGRDGLAYARRTAKRFLHDGGIGQVDWRSRAAQAHEGFVARRLSPGGAADLLAMTLFVDAVEDRFLENRHMEAVA